MDTAIQTTTEEFLEDIFGNSEADIYFNVNGRSWKDKPQPYSEAQSTLAWRNEDEQADIYLFLTLAGLKTMILPISMLCLLTGMLEEMLINSIILLI